MYMDVYEFTQHDWDLGYRVGNGRRDTNNQRRLDNKDNSKVECSREEDIIGALAEVAFHRLICVTPEYNKMVLTAEQFNKQKAGIADVFGKTGIGYEVKSINKKHLNMAVNVKGHTKDKKDRTFVLILVDKEKRTATALGWVSGAEVSKAPIDDRWSSPFHKIMKKDLHSMADLP